MDNAKKNTNTNKNNDKSKWDVYYKDNELKEEIGKDIERTYQEHLFFRSPVIKDMLLRILFIYAKQYPKVRYRQGI